MWYVILIVVIVFETVVSLVAPLFLKKTPVTIDTSITAINTTSDIIASGINPLTFFVNVLTFQIDGLESVSVIFWLCNILIGLCVIKLIRGS